MKKSFSTVFVITLFFFTTFLGGCIDEGGGEDGAINLPSKFQKPPEPVPERVDMDIYWDATISMKGYTTLAAGNVYRTLPDLLVDIGNSMGDTKFYRFGENITLLEGKEYRRFSSPDPYTEIITAVHNVIDNTDNKHLSIIITDLFESDSDWSNVTKKLRDKYFAQHQAVAVIGIKNSFNGDIFDVGLNAAKFNYNSADLPDKFRPFYLIAIGSEKIVEEFMDIFQKRQTLPNETGYLLLSESLTRSNEDFSKLQTVEIENFYSNDRLRIEDKRIKEFGIDSFTDPATFTINFNYEQFLGACKIDMSALEPQVQVMYLEEGEWKLKSENDVTIEMTAVEGNANNYLVKVTLTPEKSFVKDKINFVQASVAPKAKGYLLPDWVNTWNMANVDVAPENFDGSKTVNLTHVLGSLKDSVFATTHPTLININFIVDTR